VVGKRKQWLRASFVRGLSDAKENTQRPSPQAGKTIHPNYPLGNLLFPTRLGKIWKFLAGASKFGRIRGRARKKEKTTENTVTSDRRKREENSRRFAAKKSTGAKYHKKKKQNGSGNKRPGAGELKWSGLGGKEQVKKKERNEKKGGTTISFKSRTKRGLGDHKNDTIHARERRRKRMQTINTT